MSNSKPNIIFVNLDGSRWDRLNISSEFQNLSKDGTLLDNVSVTAPYTVAAMNSIFTGLHGKENGIDCYYKMFNLLDSIDFLPEIFQKNGYYTICNLFHDKVVSKRGFDIHESHDEYNDDLNIIHPELIKRSFELSNGKPIFCFLQYSTIHKVTVSERLKKYEWNDNEFYKNKEKNLESFDKSFLESCIYAKKIQKTINELDKTNETIIVFFTDHGTGVGERFGERNYGSFTFEETIRTYYLFIGPQISKNKKTSELLSTLDIMPTLLQLCNIEINLEIEGISFASFLVNDSNHITPRKYTFSETGALQGPYPSPKEPNVFCIKSNKFKLIFMKSPDKWQLFDIENDPQEKNDLFGKGLIIEHEFKEKLLNWINR